MTKNNETDRGLYLVLFRILLTTLCLFGTMWISENYFNDSYTVNLCLYLIAATVVEMLVRTPRTMKWGRFAWYVVILVCMGITGFFLVKSASDCDCIQHQNFEGKK